MRRWLVAVAVAISVSLVVAACSSGDEVTTEERDTAAGIELLARMKGRWQVVEAVRGFEEDQHVTRASLQFDTYLNGGVEDQTLGVNNGCNGSSSGRIVWGPDGYEAARQREEAPVSYDNQGESCDESIPDAAFVLSSIPIGSLVAVELTDEDARARLSHEEWEILIERLPDDV